MASAKVGLPNIQCRHHSRRGDQIAIAIAALGQIEKETRQLERQWALRRERARYEAERARRQYDAVELENRLVARSLERGWEEKLRVAEAIEQDYERRRSNEPLVLSESDRQALQKLGEDLPGIWHAPSTTSAERKGILRLIIGEVVLDQKRFQGQVWRKILWQTGATSEHALQRRVHTYGDYVDLERLRSRVVELNAAGMRMLRKNICQARGSHLSALPPLPVDSKDITKPQQPLGAAIRLGCNSRAHKVAAPESTPKDSVRYPS